MNTKTILAGVSLCALAITGCVTVESVQTQLKSGDAAQVAEAKEALTKIITEGSCGISVFKRQDRERCAALVADSKQALAIIETMSHRYRPSSNSADEEEYEACKGVAGYDNAGVFKIVLSKVDEKNPDDMRKVMSILLRGDIEYQDKTFAVAKEYIVQAIGRMTDRKMLMELYRTCSDWLKKKKYELLMQLDNESVVVKRLIALAKSQGDLATMYCNLPSREDKGKRLILEKITDGNALLALAEAEEGERLKSEIYAKITDEKTLTRLAISVRDEMWNSTMSEAGAEAVKRIGNKELLTQIALFARNSYIAGEAKRKVGDAAMQDAVVKLVKAQKISEEKVADVVAGLSDDAATIPFYDCVEDRGLKLKVFAKLSEENRKAVRARNRAKCEKLIADAKQKSSETFELGGFYLGMDISDVDDLVGYYCPAWSNAEGFTDDEKTIRGIFIPQQKGAFCRAGKDGKVFELNFGKNFLKKFYKFDVQNEREWANAYGKATGCELQYKHIDKSTSVFDGDMTYHANFVQDSYTYKQNAKEYRVTYFGEQKIFASNGVVKQIAADRMRYVGGQQGMLRAKIERD